MQKRWKKWISFAVIAGLLSAYLPAPVMGETASTGAVQSSATTKPDPHAKDVLMEVVSKREENVKHFLLKDKSYEAAVYPGPVHYKENGKWTDIDNTLIDAVDLETNQKVVENKANGLKIQFAKSTKNKNLVKVKASGHEVVFGLDGAQDSEVVASQVFPSGYEKLSDNDKQKTLLNLTSKATYPDILPRVDLSYVVTSTNVKENIVLNDASAPTSFEFILRASQLVVTEKDGALTFADKQHPENILFETAAPYMVDANGVQSQDIQVSLAEKANGYTLTLKPSVTWLHDSTRAYPVTIDPTLTLSGTAGVTDTFVSSMANSTNYNSFGTMRVGTNVTSNVNRALMKFNVPVIGSSSYLQNARLWLSAYSNTGDTTQVNLYKVKQDWTSNIVTWDLQPTYDSARVFDYAQVLNETEVGASWDITDLAQQWMVYGQNYGIMLRANNESGTYSDFYSTDIGSTLAGDRPIAYFDYIDAAGIEDYWTYHSQDVGRAGTSYVNDITGNLVFTHQDTSMNGARMPVSINHVYNSTDAGDANIGFGKGWRLNYSQEIIPIDSSNFKYIDEDGTTHYFVLNTSSYPFRCYDESGLNLTMTINSISTNEYYVVKDKSDNTLSFNADGDLKYIKDANGNTVTLTYNSAKFLTKITDGSGRISTLVRDASGNLTQIKDSANRATLYGYTNGDLTSITYPDGEISRYTYDSSHFLTEAKSIDGYRLNYIYTSVSPKRVSKVTESHLSATGVVTNGQFVSFAYGAYKSTFTDNKGNVEVYMYDKDGHTTSVRDDKGNGSYSGFSPNIGITKNKLTSASKLQRISTNLILNHNVENTDYWAGGSESGDVGAFGYDTNPNLGYKSLYVVKSNTAGKHWAKQNVTVTAGNTYTLSGFIATDGVGTVANAGARMAFRYTDANNNYVTVKGPTLTGTHEFERYDFSVDLPATLGSTTATVFLEIEGTTGKAYFDNLQLEVGETPSRYNLIENADMSTTTTLANGATFPKYYSQTLGSATSHTYTAVAGGPPQLDDNVVKITGVATEKRNVYQEINIGGNAGDKFTFGAWAIGDSVPQDETRAFALWLVFYNTDNTTTYVKSNFNDNVNEWQYLSASAIAQKSFTKIRVYGIYYYNQNSASFDGFQLYKEPFESTIAYDELTGDVTGTEEVDGSKESFAYGNGNSDVTSYVDADNKTTTLGYDTNHQVTTTTSPTGVNSTFTYDNFGNVTSSSVSAPNGKSIVKSMTYSSDSNYMESMTDASGNKISNTYDLTTGNLLTVTDPYSKVLTNTYDPDNDNLLSVSKVVGSQTVQNSYSYTQDKLTSIQQNGTAIDLGYNVFGQNTSVKVGGNSLVTNSYDNTNHLLTNSLYANGQQSNLTYDNLDRITKKSLANTSSQVFSYLYDNDGNLAKVNDSVTGDYTRFDYDVMGRLTRSFDQDRNTFYNTYNVLGQLANHTLKTGTNSYNTSFTYTDSGAPNTVGVGNTAITYSYDSLDRLTTKSIGLSTPYTVTTGYAAGAGTNTTTNLVSSYKNGTDTAYAYTYDKLGNIATVIKDSKTTAYFYDELNEVIRENNQANNQTILYSYDLGGNIVSKSIYPYTTGTPTSISKKFEFAYDNTTWNDLLTSVTTTTYVNGVGTATTENIAYANGQTDKVTGIPSQIGGATLTWTWGNQLATYENASIKVTYTYNDAGIRTSKTVYTKSTATTTVTNYVLDGDIVAYETDGTNKLHYTYNSAGELVSVNFNGTEYYYIFDAQGNVIGLINSAGTQVVKYTYDAYGNTISTTGSESGSTQVGGKNPYRYKGYRLDAETNWYYLQSRNYSPSLSRFISADDVVGKPGELLSHNMFAYARSNPINHADSEGNWVVDVVFLVMDVAEFVACPSPAGAAWIIGDLASFADPTGAASTALHAKKIIQAAEKIEHTTKISRKYWKGITQFKGNRVYKRDDLFNPLFKDKRGRTNIQRMKKGLAPIGKDGKSINLHHMTQRQSSAIAEVSSTFHSSHSSIIHINPSSVSSGINRKEFGNWRRSYWKNRANDF
jgi:RHS repeat-associated protein